MPISEKDFNFWVEEESYIPTARLNSWPNNWYNTRNLRFFGSVSWVAAVPHDIESRVRIEALHKSISKHEYFDPFIYETNISPNSNRKSVYVSLIPRPVVDWFSKHTMDEIHDQVAMYIALYEIEQEYANKNVIGDTHSIYNPTIQHHLRNFQNQYPHLSREYLPLGPHDIFENDNKVIEDYNAFFQRKDTIEIKWRTGNPQEARLYDDKKDNFWKAWGNLLEYLFEAEKLPQWFLKKNERESTSGQTYNYLSLQKLKSDKDFSWQRPTGALADDFGIVSYGITCHDELRLQGQKIDYDKKIGKEVMSELTSKELEYAKMDMLSRTESDSTVFDFLMYAKSKNKEWPNWTISNVQNTGYIYLYSDGRAYKIGFSHYHPDLEKRKKSIQTHNSGEIKLVGYIEGTREKEKILHRKYQNKRTQGEWFDLNPDDINSILAGNAKIELGRVLE